jgi:dihydrodipicolinate synthase/N-acetylneuraminate lyase
MSGVRLHGAIAAAVTPLTDSGRTLDEPAVERLVGFLAAGGLDGALIAGTTGEGVLLHVDERRRLIERAVVARPEGFAIAVHAGAQSTQDTVALAAHARDAGADAVAVIAPPYFPLDGVELFAHFLAAAQAADPLPFYVYEFAGRSGYTIPVAVIERLRDEAANLAGLKVSDTPFDAVRPYLLDGLDVFVGSEPLVLEGMAAGAVGAVSGLATAWPRVVAELVHDRSEEAGRRVTALRRDLAGIPFHAALKQVLVDAGVLGAGDVRPPLRGLSDDERALIAGLATAVSG